MWYSFASEKEYINHSYDKCYNKLASPNVDFAALFQSDSENKMLCSTYPLCEKTAAEDMLYTVVPQEESEVSLESLYRTICIDNRWTENREQCKNRF